MKELSDKLTKAEFNDKWKPYIQEGFEGSETDNEYVNIYLDSEFTKEIAVNPNFKFSQIKWKFGSIRIYADSNKTSEWEKNIDSNIRI
jgi:hypothetical protein